MLCKGRKHTFKSSSIFHSVHLNNFFADFSLGFRNRASKPLGGYFPGRLVPKQLRRIQWFGRDATLGEISLWERCHFGSDATLGVMALWERCHFGSDATFAVFPASETRRGFCACTPAFNQSIQEKWLCVLVTNYLCVIINVKYWSYNASDGVYIYRVSQEEWTKLRESVPYVELYRYNPKHLYTKLNGYGDNGHRKVWASGVSTYCMPSVTPYPSTAHARQIDTAS